MRMSRLIDVSLPITSNTIVYPGDPAFSCRSLYSLQAGDSYGLSEMKFGNHTGTHVDFPAHVLPDGKTSSDYPIGSLIRQGRVIDMPHSIKVITADSIAATGVPLQKDSTVFFRTRNSSLWQVGRFTEDFVYLDRSAALYLRDAGVGLIGIDYISVDACHAADLPVHRILLSNGTLLVEGLDLRCAPAGEYEINCVPLNIPNMDGLPARVFLRS